MTHLLGRKICDTTDLIVFSIFNSSFRAGVIRTYEIGIFLEFKNKSTKIFYLEKYPNIFTTIQPKKNKSVVPDIPEGRQRSQKTTAVVGN
jgi:hypothetical protein